MESDVETVTILQHVTPLHHSNARMLQVCDIKEIKTERDSADGKRREMLPFSN